MDKAKSQFKFTLTRFISPIYWTFAISLGFATPGGLKRSLIAANK